MRTPLRLPSFKGFSLSRGPAPTAGRAELELPEAAFAPGLDLLRERRRELGQEPITVALADRRRLLTQGTLVGAIVFGVVLGLISLVYLRHQMVKSQMGQLTQVEAQSTQLQQEMGASKARLERITTINRQLVGALIGVRSSSALMTELQLRIPAGIQLLEANASGPALVLRGQTFDPNAFERINALQLELKKSPLFDPGAITLSKVERKPPETAQPAGVKPPVGFELTATFAQLGPSQQLQLLRQLGAGGLARRLELLQREGLLP
jgi:type IV pilus assembly protein PilN